MRYLKFDVRSDWHEFEQWILAECEQMWRSVQVVVGLSVGVLLLVTYLSLAWPVGLITKLFFSSVLFILFSLWSVIRSDTGARRWLVASLGFAAAALLAGLTAKPFEAVLVGFSGNGKPVIPLGFVALAPVFGWGAMLWVYRQHPAALRRLGFSLKSWPVDLLLGVVTAIALGGHFLLSTRALPRPAILPAFDQEVLIWVLCVHLGLISIGEELLLRGVGFLNLYEETHRSFWRSSTYLAVITALIYLVPNFLNPITPWWFAVIIYRITLSFMVTYLRHKQGSLLPGIICNVIFSTMLATTVRW